MRGRVGNRAPYRVCVAVLDRDVLDDLTLLSPLGVTSVRGVVSDKSKRQDSIRVPTEQN
jgi:hypothetical protein